MHFILPKISNQMNYTDRTTKLTDCGKLTNKILIRDAQIQAQDITGTIKKYLQKLSTS